MDFNICPGLRAFAADAHTASVPNFLPAGNVSRPSISSLMSGIYDSGMELNEKEIFWNNTLPTALAAQMKRLGYQTIYWYGGNSSSGNFTKYGRAQGFDRIENATEFCGPQALQTWLGVYDHIFLEETAKRIMEMDEPTFHFVYTTTNHGPYKLEDKNIDFDARRDLPGVKEDIINRKDDNKGLAMYKYCDKAIFDFVDTMKDKYPDSLFVVTGDHSALFGEFNNTSFLQRDYTVREKYNTVFYMQHPELLQTSLTASIGTHLSIMPTIIEAIAPKGFEYYALVPSAFDEQPDIHVTPYQWITDNMVGDVREDYGQYQEYMADEVEYIRPIDNHAKEADDWRSLSVWLMRYYTNKK
jgi:arylsulfatase